MNTLGQGLCVIGLAICGGLPVAASAQSLGLQENIQIVEVFGNENRDIQETSQFIFEMFDIDAFFTSESDIYFDFSDLSASLEPEFSQFSFQEVLIEGHRNRVTQTLDQTMVSLFYIDGHKQGSFDFSLLDDSWVSLDLLEPPSLTDWIRSEEPLDFEQISFQDSFIFGNRNRVSQFVNQTQLNLFLFDADFAQLETDRLWDFPPLEVWQESDQFSLVEGDRNRVKQTTLQTWIGVPILTPDSPFDGTLENELNQLLEPDWVSQLIDSWLASSTSEALFLGERAFVSELVNTTSIPEPTSWFTLFGLGVLGSIAKISSQSKKQPEGDLSAG